MSEYIPRLLTDNILRTLPYYQVIVITGPRQSGKSTLCRHTFPDYTYYNLEDYTLRDRVKSDVKAFIDGAGDHTIIDEVQNYPQILSYIQVAVDADPNRKFVITGSCNFALMQNVAQSLVGRACVFTLLPLSLKELGNYPSETPTDQLMFNGFYPAIFSKRTPPTIFYSNYNALYVERDVRQLFELRNQDKFATFMRLCALRIGTELNKADLAKSVGVSATTISDWISILKASYILFTLQPYFPNVQKRLTKTPKIYFYDTGLAAYLMGLKDPTQMDILPVRGALFENMAILELLKAAYNQGQDPLLYFYRENSGKEVDIIEDAGISLKLFEIKSSSSFRPEFLQNMRYLENLLQAPSITSTLIYDGDPQPPSILNIRDI